GLWAAAPSARDGRHPGRERTLRRRPRRGARTADVKRIADRLVIAGVGLIGGSLALALRARGVVGAAVGLGRSAENLRGARRRGAARPLGRATVYRDTRRAHRGDDAAARTRALGGGGHARRGDARSGPRSDLRAREPSAARGGVRARQRRGRCRPAGRAACARVRRRRVPRLDADRGELAGDVARHLSRERCGAAARPRRFQRDARAAARCDRARRRRRHCRRTHACADDAPSPRRGIGGRAGALARAPRRAPLAGAVSAITITPAARGLHGAFAVPGDKSIAHRALLLGAIARGATVVEGFAGGADNRATLDACTALGVAITTTGATLRIDGRGWDGLRAPGATLDCRNSGTTIRLLAGLLAGR